MKNVLFIILGLLVFTNTNAQIGFDNNDDDPYESLSYFMAGANYLSNNVYMGRKDSLVIPYYSPYIGYHHKSGLYGKAIASYNPAKAKGRIDLFTLEAGYDHSFGDHLYGGVAVDKFFYHKKSTNIRGNTVASTSAYAQYTNDWIEPQLNVDVNFNKKTDYVLGITLDHNFKLADNKLNIIPAAVMNFGTLHYYNEYFRNRLLQEDPSLKITKEAIADASKFKPLDIELSTKVTYSASRWLFTLIPVYAIPLSPASITFPTKTFNEKLTNTFYFELDICFRGTTP